MSSGNRIKCDSYISIFGSNLLIMNKQYRILNEEETIQKTDLWSCNPILPCALKDVNDLSGFIGIDTFKYIDLETKDGGPPLSWRGKKIKDVASDFTFKREIIQKQSIWKKLCSH